MILLQMGPPPFPGMGTPPIGFPGPCSNCIAIDEGALLLIAIGLGLGLIFLHTIDKKRK